MEWFSELSPLASVIVLIVGLAVGWVALRFVLRLALRAFWLGCGVIVVVGLLCVLFSSLLR